MAFLSYAPHDAEIYAAVVEKARELAFKRDQWLVESVANRTASLTTYGITRWLSKAFAQIFSD